LEVTLISIMFLNMVKDIGSGIKIEKHLVII